MKTVEEWFAEYGESHQNSSNKMIHWICVPAIFFSVIGLLYSVKLFNGINLAYPVLIAASLFYVRLSWRLAIGTIAYALFCIWVCAKLEMLLLPLPLISICVFGVAWIGQFYGHHIEGKRPSFIKDLQFLLIGPVWLLGFAYRKIGFNY